MKTFRAITLFIGITFFINGTFTSDNESGLSSETNVVKSTNSQENLDELVNSFDRAIQEGEVDIFYREISNKAEK